MLVAAHGAAHPSAQRFMEAMPGAIMPGAIVLPATKVAVTGSPVWLGARQLAPRTAGREQIKHGVEGLAQTHGARASTEFRLGQ